MVVLRQLKLWLSLEHLKGTLWSFLVNKQSFTFTVPQQNRDLLLKILSHRATVVKSIKEAIIVILQPNAINKSLDKTRHL